MPIVPKYQPLSDVARYIEGLYKSHENKPIRREIWKSIHEALCNGSLVATAVFHKHDSHRPLHSNRIGEVNFPKELWATYDMDSFENRVIHSKPWKEKPDSEYSSFYENVRIETQEIEKIYTPKKEVINKTTKEDIGTRERGTLLRLVIGLATIAYNGDFNMKEIQSDLDKVGINLDDETIKKWLKEAKQYLPREEK